MNNHNHNRTVADSYAAHNYAKTARTARDVCRDACAIERPLPSSTGHHLVVWVGLACLVILYFVY